MSCPSGKALKTWAPRLPRGGRGRGGSPPLPLPLAPGHLGGLALYSPSVEPAANVHGGGWGCTKQLGGGVRRRRLRAACSAASSKREALSPGAAAKATRTACTTETSRDFPRSPEISLDLPRDLPSDEGRLHDMPPAGPHPLQRKRDEPARAARGGGIGRRNEGDGRRGAQVAVRKRVGARCHPELALRRRSGEQCSAAGGVGRPHRAQARWRWPSAACLPEGGERRPHLVGCVTAMSWICPGHVPPEGRAGRPLGCVRATQSQVWEGYDTQRLPPSTPHTSRAETPAGSSQNLEESSTAVHHPASTVLNGAECRAACAPPSSATRRRHGLLHCASSLGRYGEIWGIVGKSRLLVS